MIVLQFPTEEYQRGCSFNYLSSYISTLRNCLPEAVLNANVILKFMKEICRLRPPKTKYQAIGDVQTLLEFLENISLDNDMDVSRKLVCLFMVLFGSRISTISKLKITYVFDR